MKVKRFTFYSRLLIVSLFASIGSVMTNYHLTPPTTLPSLAVQEAKEKRRRVLEAVRQRRREVYTRFFEKKRLLQANGDIDTMASYGR